MPEADSNPGQRFGRYLLFDEIGRGGMASVHIARLLGPVGFSRTVAVKRLHGEYLREPEFLSMFLDEARLAARVQHPNVVQVLDVVATGSELLLVMEYVRGESLAQLLKRLKNRPIPVNIAMAIATDLLYGLHAAHEATTETGEPLHIVHRDVSPQNVLVGTDGISRVTDFGIAKAAARIASTRDGQLKGKLAYMSPEQIRRRRLDRRTDVFAASAVLWELLTGERLFAADDPGGIVHRILHEPVVAPSQKVSGLDVRLDHIVLKGLAKERSERFATAREMAAELEAFSPARAVEVAGWVERHLGESLRQRAARVLAIEQASAVFPAENQLARPSETSTSGGTIAPSEPAGSDIAVTPRSTKWAPALPATLFTLVLASLVAIVIVYVVARRPAGAGTTPAALSPSPPETKQEEAGTLVPIDSSAETKPLDPPAGSVAGPSTRPIRLVPRGTPTATSAPEPSCNPPYTIDRRGIRVYKRECLAR